MKSSFCATFIRHGQSTSNAGLKTEHPATIPLTDLGRQQAADLVKIITTEPNIIITSSYLRTQQTATFIKKKFSTVPTEVWPIHEFTYLSVEKYKNTSSADRRNAVIEYWERADPTYEDGGGAESFQNLIKRVDDLITKLLNYPLDNMLFFTHGQFMKALWWRLFVSDRRLITSDCMKNFARSFLEISIDNTALLKVIDSLDGWFIQLSQSHVRH